VRRILAPNKKYEEADWKNLRYEQFQSFQNSLFIFMTIKSGA
jgi:hypothetical protein